MELPHLAQHLPLVVRLIHQPQQQPQRMDKLFQTIMRLMTLVHHNHNRTQILIKLGLIV